MVTGQVGLDKKQFLSRVVELARDSGDDLTLCNVGDMMYAEAPDVSQGRILDLPLSRLHSLRRSVFKDILAVSNRSANVLINTHATFRWRHGLFHAFDYDHMQTFDADLYVVLVDNIDRVHYRLVRDGHVDHTLKDLMVWREEEILATELLSQIVSGHGCFYISAIGHDDSTAETLLRLLFHPQLKKAYLSYPMTHLQFDTAGRATMAIEEFRSKIKRHFTCFDPGDLEEKNLGRSALQAAEQGRRTVQLGPSGETISVDTNQLLEIIPDIDGQIYARDFKLIDQSEMIISLVPELAGGRPGISSGVERELQHAHEATKDVFVIWQGRAEPSPFVTETATRVFGSIDEAIEFFHSNGYLPASPSGGLFS